MMIYHLSVIAQAKITKYKPYASQLHTMIDTLPYVSVFVCMCVDSLNHWKSYQPSTR